ncbi:MAG: GTP 3',8-cyclase MoaA [Phycisphaerales bacterium]|nr:GTP 3',8-cyclase MoaA [Phycisphaerales bacterium]
MGLALTVLPRAGRSGGPPQAPPISPRRGERRLVDSHGRTIRDLRLSITDRCNFRCVYCMEPDVRFLPREGLLTVDELIRVARACVSLGAQKIRITGGEPAVRPELPEIIAGVAALGVADVALTTNGSIMDARTLAAWREAGLTRITISIDSLDPGAFARVTRSRTTPRDVIDGVRRAVAMGFHPVKLNAVIVRGLNEDQVVPLAALARDLGVEMRYIEFMPLDSAHAWDRSRVVPAAEIAAAIDRVYPLVPLGRHDVSSTALDYAFADGAPGGGRIGLIAPVTRPFCGACSRLRITADGKVRPCLFSTREWDLRPLLRDGCGDTEIEDFLLDATWTKQAGHGISAAGFEQPARPMSAIGG